MTQEPTIKIDGAVLRDSTIGISDALDFSLNAREHIAIVGPNGSGKTILVETLLGMRALRSGKVVYDFPQGGMASDNIKYIAFQGVYGSLSGDYYYQQRWNSTDRDGIPIVRELLDKIAADPHAREKLYDLMGIGPLLEKEIILLSSGELRKFQITKILLSSPKVLIIDNPHIGLDFKAREMLDGILGQLATDGGIQIILVVTSQDVIPGFITDIYTIKDRLPGKKTVWVPASMKKAASALHSSECSSAGESLESSELPGEGVIRLNNVNIRYGTKQILRDQSWTVRRGERWALAGLNGSGKSTLLSLISADNPQSYSQDITLFGRRRGSGESIWDIKRRIGFISSEMHNSYREDIPAVGVVASGFFDSLGLYRTPDQQQLQMASEWMGRFGISNLRDKSFLRLSSGEQRLILLARAFVKDPELLILDEPLNGLDPKNKQVVRGVIDKFCREGSKTLIVVTHYEEDLPDCVSKTLRLTAPGN